MKRCVTILLILGMLFGLAGCDSEETEATRAELEARLVELEAENAELKATEEKEIDEQVADKSSEVNEVHEQQEVVEETSSSQESDFVNGDELDAYINVLYVDKKKLKDTEKYTSVAYYLDNKQVSKYYILRDIDNDGIKELYISDSQTSDTCWWCIFDYVNEEVIIPLTYESDSTIQNSALLNNNMIYRYAHSGLSSEAIYPGAYSSAEFSGENNDYYLYSLNSKGLKQDEIEMFWQSGVMKEDTEMPNLYYIQGEAVSFDEWEAALNQHIVSQEIKAEKYTILSEENLRSNQMAEEAETSDTEVVNEDSDIESDIQNIKEIYYSIQENINSYIVEDGGDGTTRYIDKNNHIRKITAPKGAYSNEMGEALLHYSAEYYYNDASQLVFVFVYEGHEEYRYYVKNGKCIRYIDANGTVTDYSDGAQHGTIAYTDCFIDTGMMEMHWASSGY